MPYRKIASNLLWTPEGFLRHPLVRVGGDGRIERVSTCEEPDRSACTEFYAGILTPAFVDASAIASKEGFRSGFLCLTSASAPKSPHPSLRSEGTSPKICIGADPAAPDPLRSMLDTLRAATDTPLHELLKQATLNGALALGISGDAGSVEIGKRCGLCLLSGIDYERMTLTPDTTIRRIL